MQDKKKSTDLLALYDLTIQLNFHLTCSASQFTLRNKNNTNFSEYGNSKNYFSHKLKKNTID